MIRYLIVCLLAFVAGLMNSIAGEDGPIALPAYFIARVPAYVVLGTDKLSPVMGTIVSTVRFAKHGHLKGKIFVAVYSAVAALVGSSPGARLALMVSETVIKHMMILTLPVVAFYALRNKDMGAGKRTGATSGKKALAIRMLVVPFVGDYDGFYRPETGTFLVLVFTGTAGLDTRSTSAQTKVINLASSAAVLVTLTFAGNMLYPPGPTAGVCSIAGHYIEAGTVAHDGQKVARPVVLLVPAVLFVRILSGN